MVDVMFLMVLRVEDEDMLVVFDPRWRCWWCARW